MNTSLVPDGKVASSANDVIGITIGKPRLANNRNHCSSEASRLRIMRCRRVAKAEITSRNTIAPDLRCNRMMSILARKARCPVSVLPPCKPEPYWVGREMASVTELNRLRKEPPINFATWSWIKCHDTKKCRSTTLCLSITQRGSLLSTAGEIAKMPYSSLPVGGRFAPRELGMLARALLQVCLRLYLCKLCTGRRSMQDQSCQE